MLFRDTEYFISYLLCITVVYFYAASKLLNLSYF